MIAKEVQWILYGVLVVVAGFSGYYIGEKYSKKEMGAGLGVVAGLIVAGGLYMYNDSPTSLSY